MKACVAADDILASWRWSEEHSGMKVRLFEGGVFCDEHVVKTSIRGASIHTTG